MHASSMFLCPSASGSIGREAHRSIPTLCHKIRYVLEIAQIWHLTLADQGFYAFSYTGGLSNDAEMPEADSLGFLVITQQDHPLHEFNQAHL